MAKNDEVFINITVPPEWRKKLKILSAKEGKTIKQILMESAEEKYPELKK